MKIAVFGGSFNPPHVAHVLAGALVRSTEDVDRLLVVPTYRHPFGKPLEPFSDRLAMCELAMAWMRGVEVSRVEATLGGESRTLRTLQHLAEAYPGCSLRLVMGADVLAEAPRWFGFDEIARLAPPIVLGRVGVDVPGAGPALLPNVSSTHVRAVIARGAWSEAEKLVPQAVLGYVRARGLYGAPA
ncbi:MAG: nicotinate-nicotinamide nucleotide adenylyltransferase [Myxococcota bacterium]|nr:nicotinate-nicotinamide nucleotide adenylyltransferase [Myxococcota bacterium]